MPSAENFHFCSSQIYLEAFGRWQVMRQDEMEKGKICTHPKKVSIITSEIRTLFPPLNSTRPHRKSMCLFSRVIKFRTRDVKKPHSASYESSSIPHSCQCSLHAFYFMWCYEPFDTLRGTCLQVSLSFYFSLVFFLPAIFPLFLHAQGTIFFLALAGRTLACAFFFVICYARL